jgi:hypothetical protein
MTTIHAPAAVAGLDDRSETLVQFAARRLYEAELALHAARQSGVDHWIAAAADRLHDAVTNYLITETAASA